MAEIVGPPQTQGYQTYPDYVGTDGVETGVPYLLPPQFTWDKPNSITIADVYLPPATPPVPAQPAYGTDFELKWNVKVPTTQAATLEVTILNANQWKGAPAARLALRNSFIALAEALDELERPTGKGEQPVLVPGAAAIVLRRVAEIIPAAIAESPFYFYGLNTGIGTATPCPYVDLAPGMRLLLQPEPSQFAAPGNPLNGPAPGAPLVLQLSGVTGADGYRRVCFDTFLGAIAAPQIANKAVGPTAPQTVIGGVLDLQASGTARRLYRLLYPNTLPPASSPGDVQLSDSITLVGAESRADLEAATIAFQAGKSATGVSAPLVYSVIRGRVAVAPQVAVNLDGAVTWVALGTTVRDLVEQLVFSNPLVWGSQVELHRRCGATPPSLQPLVFNPGKTTLTDPHVYELPVVQGDMISVAGWS
jgi:hypothetical protein